MGSGIQKEHTARSRAGNESGVPGSQASLLLSQGFPWGEEFCTVGWVWLNAFQVSPGGCGAFLRRGPGAGSQESP